ncbi:hypothetical protein POM88_027648 [Heracleum sosnowskyi]|uniref:HMG box domain-containing protein n=1 Tax=Heracleum sosnowskyi TaxID=360622 RepID=A0AAD8I868_9APIA|nr:hypothetical protein POM88_027648 [Heracleum sosnowskyi]
MVTTRSMTGTSKKTDTRLAVKVTSSMAGTSKKTNTKLAEKDKQKAAKIASNKAKSGKPKIIATKGTTRRMTVMDEAYFLFIGHYKDEHYKKCPPLPTERCISKELILAIQKKWMDMSDKDKAPFKKRAKENRANGCVQL